MRGLEHPRNRAVLAAIVYSLVIGFSFVFVKFALIYASPLDLLAHRFTFSFGCALVFVACGWWRLQWRPATLSALLPLSIFQPVLFFGLQTYGLASIAASEAGIIQACIPILTLLLATYFLKERSTIIQRLCIVLSVTGIIFIFVWKGAAAGFGDIGGLSLLLLSALAAASFTVMTRAKTQRFGVIDITFVMMGVGFVVFNTLALATHIANGTLGDYIAPLAQPMFWLAIVYLGGISSLVSSLLNNYALTHMPASQMSVFMNLSTLVTIIAGVAVLGEKLQWFHILGASLVISGVIGTNFAAQQARNDEAQLSK